ncbi:MAG TPA: hypothetical protein VFZ65_03780 [Planctomycetota bacterium]|nr:hypothetical protein [Planctomycetota bacterium]
MPIKFIGLLIIAPLAVAQAPPTPRAGPEPMLLPQAVVLPRGDRAIAIDGSLIDWPELPAIRLDDKRQLSGTFMNAWHGQADLSAVAFMMWDPEALYFACAVKDEWHRALDASTLALTEVPAADSVVLTFDPERNTRALGNDPGRREDREFWLADEVGRHVVQWDRLRGTARVLEGDGSRLVVLHDKEQGITTYEARIPMAEILPAGHKPTVGLVIDMQIVVNDFDETTDSMPQTRIGWTFGCSPIIDPGLLGSIMLVGDAAALHGAVPEFPPKPGVAEPPAPPSEYWQQLTTDLVQHPPAVYDGSATPEEAGGLQRLAVLERIEQHTDRFPRVDYIEFLYRVHRRMLREVAGISARGLPSWWHQRLETLSKKAEDQVPKATVRVFRLPMGGWLFRSPVGNFMVDPVGADLADWLWGGADFCILTEPLDMARRNDQLLVRMLSATPPHPVLNHIAFHLPAIAMNAMPLVEQGKSYGQEGGVRIHALGSKREDGSVTWSCSYRVELPGGPTILFVGMNLRAAEVPEADIDLLILSSRNAEALEIVRKAKPRLVLFDDAFVCQSRPGVRRVDLHDIHALQRALSPQRSVVLAPGESWDVTKEH